ncbi:MAG: OmpH family outer membrane protein [Henriciella sp.]|jgi:outer membrane protein|nr:OmpH family outer membrane protein [Henriciella sp.]
MFPLKSIMAAFALLFTAPIALSSVAMAQGTTVVVIDRVKIYAESAAGQDLRNKVASIETTMQGELQPTATKLQADGTALDAKTEGMTRETILADAALTAEVEQLARDAQVFQQRRQIAANELALTERAALAEFNQALIPVLREVVAETGANIILDKSQVVFVDDATDVSASVISKLNAATPTINVVRQKMPTQQPQQ